MNDRQRCAKYFPCWNEAFRANWRMDRGRVLPREGRVESEWLAAVEAAAQQLALTTHCASTTDHLRHACTISAVGRQKSSKDLTNPELDKVLAWFALLVDPDNVQAVVNWQHPELAEEQWKIAQILEMKDEAVVVHVARDLFKCDDWRKLGVAKLEMLRRKFWKQTHPERRELAAANAPY